jgi:hypothetical protein
VWLFLVLYFLRTYSSSLPVWLLWSL